jgi:hypothetical protein
MPLMDHSFLFLQICCCTVAGSHLVFQAKKHINWKLETLWKYVFHLVELHYAHAEISPADGWRLHQKDDTVTLHR